jgi:histidinol phosphatase-like PHP family hydrolase
MIDLHTHSLFSDGELLPSELIQRVEALSYDYLGITDHADASNLDWIIPRLVLVTRQVNQYRKVQTVPGVELTHLPPETIPEMAAEARRLGARLVVVHGETLVEPVPQGTNRAAVEADVDILAHPGLITEEEALLAAKNGVLLEVSTRKGHCLSNGHVVQVARKTGAGLILNTDSHGPGDFVTRSFAMKTALGAGLDEKEFERIISAARALAQKALSR